jgi:serine protease inhibitor
MNSIDTAPGLLMRSPAARTIGGPRAEPQTPPPGMPAALPSGSLRALRWLRHSSGHALARATRLAPIGSLALAAACAETPSAPTPLDSLPRELTAAEQAVIASSNEFAFDLFRESDRRFGDGNVFLSPLSASMALGMTMNGAQGETLNEMRSMLGFGELELRQINESYRDLIALLLDLDPSVDTRIANSVWYRNGFPFDQSFLDLVADYFSAEVQGIEMVDADKATINDWVSDATGGKIRSIVDGITPLHVMFLINGIYFKGSWTRQFDPAATRDAPFRLEDGRNVQVKMMKGTLPFGHRQMNGYQVIDLPYGNGAFSMTILLPDQPGGVDALAASLDPVEWAAATTDLPRRELELHLPRFRIEYKQELNETLKALGMNAAFGRADFSGMSSSHGRELFVSRVVQKSYVEVNEEGTEAAAATSVEIIVVSAPPAVYVDRPFLFAIRERFSGTILFIGKVVDPS